MGAEGVASRHRCGEWSVSSRQGPRLGTGDCYSSCMERRVPEETSLRFAEAGGEELEELVERWIEALRPADVGRILRNPHAGDSIVRRLLAQRRLLTFYDVRRDLALHPRTPTAVALNLVRGLFWRDLVAIGQNVRIRPRVRQAAELRLGERLPALAVGERVAIARKASPGTLQKLRSDPNARVIEALMENPRCSEGILLPLATSETTTSPVLATVARHPRWGVRYPIRVAICRNPQTPTRVSLPLLPMLKKHDLRTVSREPRIPAPVRRRAQLLLGELA